MVKGTVVKKSKKNHDIYKVRFVPPNSNEQIEEWISVENIASIRKRQTGNTGKKKQALRELRKKLMIPLTACDRFLERDFPHMSIILMHNPPGNGNCQFGALCFWLNRLGIHRSPEKVREEIVQYLENNPTDTEGFPLELYAGVPWSQYLQSMAIDGTYGDQITLQAAADLYNIEVLVVSTLGHNATTLISPSASIPYARVQLGHYAEKHGEHYICVEGGTLVSEEEPHLAESYECNQEKGGDSLSSQEAEVVPAKRREEASAVPTDKSPVPVEIRFVGDDSVGMVNHLDDLTCHMDRLPNEILTIIIDKVLISSNFSWPNHRCHVYNQLCNGNTRFQDITQRLVLKVLPRIYFSSLGVAGKASVKNILKMFGPSSGVVLELRRITSNKKWANAWLILRYIGLGWFLIMDIYWRNN